MERCRELARDLPLIGDYLCAACAHNFAEVRRHLDAYGLSYRVEPRLVRGIDYYTRVTFEVVTSRGGQQNAVLGGGRYDNLMKTYGGPDICATGFAMGLERLLELAKIPPKQEKFLYIAYLGEEAKTSAAWLARIFRWYDIECLLEFKDRGLKAQLSRAAKLGASDAVIVGLDEVRNNRIILKDLATGNQIEENMNWLADQETAAAILKMLLSKTSRPGLWPKENKENK